MALLANQPKRLTVPARWRSVLASRWLLLGAAALLCLWVAILAWYWPFTRQAVTAAITSEFGRPVHIGAFRATFFPLGYEVENVRLLNGANASRTDVTARKVSVVARYFDLLLARKRVSKISITGMRIIAPQTSPQPKQPATNYAPRFSEIGSIHIEDAVAQFPSSTSASDPFTITLKSGDLTGVSALHSGSFAADFSLSEPQGEVRLSGQIGPWNWKDLGRTHLTGTFALPHSDLGDLGGVAGILKSDGKCDGSLGRLVCTGTAEAPEFKIAKSSHSVNLSSTFRASVDALTGDTTLETGESHFNRTLIQSQGVIKTDTQHAGKTAFLRFSVQEGEVGDLLLLFTRAPQPSMGGRVDLRLDVELPPGPPGFLKKLLLKGDFGVDRGHFTKAKAQTPLNHLSESASGMDKKQQDESRRTVLSDLAGHVTARGGIATLTHITFTMPGAQGVLAGTYSLVNQSVNLTGTLTTQGELSSASSGLKAVFLKIVTPLMKKHSETVVPFTITGTAQHPTFALDLLHKR